MTNETDYRDAMVEMSGNELEKLREQNLRLRIALGAIYQDAPNLSGRDAIQALIDAGQLRDEDIKL